MSAVGLSLPGVAGLDEALGRHRETVEAALAHWLPAQRWFPAKSQSVSRLQLLGWCPIGVETAGMALAAVDTGEEEPVRLQLLLGLRAPGTGATELVEGLDEGDIARAFVRAVSHPGSLSGAGLTYQVSWRGGRSLPAKGTRVIAADQSNSSLVVAERVIVKVYRRVEVGPNPEAELLEYLSSVGFEGVPRVVGAGHGALGDLPFDAWLAQVFLPDAVDGWGWLLERLRGGSRGMRDARAGCRAVGELTAAMHITLGRASAPGIEPRPLTSEELLALRDGEAGLASTTAQRLARAGVDPGPVERAAARLTRWRPPDQPLGLASRVHGDYHLGQVLRSGRRWYVTDFEGEPSRPLVERRARQSPLVDVAGMLRSFDYALAAATGGASPVSLHAGFREALREAFLDSYLRWAARMPDLLPAPSALPTMLAFFELRKALYEVRYEVDNRPSWVWVPLAAVETLAEALG